MAKHIVAMTSLSLDGFFEGPDHDISWHRVDEELHAHFNEYIAASGGLLDGRRTHDLMAEVWPTFDADPENPRLMREFAPIWRAKPKVVYSRTLKPGPAPFNTTIVNEVDPDAVRELAEHADGDLLLGGADLTATFLRLGLVDEFRLYIHPAVIGTGVRLFQEGTPPMALRLAEIRAFGNGVVLMRHVVDRILT